ncbi:hypothetical protein [Streptomyces sp. NPDC021020]|uniref:hypothetical protein n=1 Tax=Streptomyces sp. NPDC021020 TaxID=3365109 RepID=UPI0037A60E6C
MTVRLLLTCMATEHCSVVLEPYGAEHVLVAGDLLGLEIEGTGEDAVEIASSPGCTTVWIPASAVSVRATDRLGGAVDLGLPL